MSEHVPDAGNMVERVARALIETHARFKLMPEQQIQIIVDREWKYHAPWARAAIAAMREPTEAMCDAAAIDSIGPHDMQIFWQEMIDSALAEEPKS